jgi:hypothetical protein
LAVRLSLFAIWTISGAALFISGIYCAGRLIQTRILLGFGITIGRVENCGAGRGKESLDDARHQPFGAPSAPGR